MGKLRAEIRSLPEEGKRDYMDKLLYDIDDAHANLYRHLVECGIEGTHIQTTLQHKIENAKRKERS